MLDKQSLTTINYQLPFKQDISSSQTTNQRTEEKPPSNPPPPKKVLLQLCMGWSGQGGERNKVNNKSLIRSTLI